jgi:hypothetical protein
LKIAIALISFCMISGCNQSAPTDEPVPRVQKDSLTSRSKDSAFLMSKSIATLEFIKERNIKELATLIHPKEGLIFSPYAFIDTANARRFLKRELILMADQNKPIDWNTSWEDKPELLSLDQYFKKFVYDVDFLNAELKSFNNFHSQGTDLNNITTIFAGCNVTEFFFSGFEKKYEGMDFRALRLVFKNYNDMPYLVAIVHDQWTP